jgi:hypothetical protein
MNVKGAQPDVGLAGTAQFDRLADQLDGVYSGFDFVNRAAHRDWRIGD